MIFPFFNSRGVLGLNARNLLYIRPFNPRKAVAFADDKMKTKAFLSTRGIPTARLFARIDTRRQLQQFDFSALPDRCVLKPNYGFGGEGIIILKGRKNGQFLVQGKKQISNEELQEHIEDILDGKFSVNGHKDSAFFEQILEAHDSLSHFRPAGLPDLRIVVFNLVPVMAMLRIPTAESGGKANVHLGGIGIGIDIAKGVTTHAAQYHHMLKTLPHGIPIAGTTIPYWEEMLLISSRIQSMTNIGYLAVDLTLDKELGPVLLEVNARAGLMLQVANLAPLQARLRRVEGLKVSSPEKGVRIAQELFGEKLGKKKDAAEKPILSSLEMIEIAGERFTLEEPAAISLDRDDTVFSPDLIDELRRRHALEPVEGSSDAFHIKFSLLDRKIQTIVKAASLHTRNTRVVIGRRDLSGYLLDPSKRSTVKTTVMRTDLRAADRILCEMDASLQLLRELRPINLAEELTRIRADKKYNPVFLFRDAEKDLEQAEEEINNIETDDSPLGILLRKKKREIHLKLNLLRSRGHAEKFTSASLALYGAPSTTLIGFAKSYLAAREVCELHEDGTIPAKKASEMFISVLQTYGLHDWQVIVKEDMVSDCAVGGKKIFLRSGAHFSEEHIQSLIAHEIETHVLTTENGMAQPYNIFRRGFANYLDTQEGLAIYNQMRVLPAHHEKNYLHAKNVLGVAFAMKHSFADVRKYLKEELGYREEKSIMKAIDFKRGISQTMEEGAFTRGLVYFRGYRAIEQYVQAGGDLKKLYTGKIAIEDIDLIDKIDNIVAPVILPKWMRTNVDVRKGKKKSK